MTYAWGRMQPWLGYKLAAVRTVSIPQEFLVHLATTPRTTHHLQAVEYKTHAFRQRTVTFTNQPTLILLCWRCSTPGLARIRPTSKNKTRSKSQTNQIKTCIAGSRRSVDLHSIDPTSSTDTSMGRRSEIPLECPHILKSQSPITTHLTGVHAGGHTHAHESPQHGEPFPNPLLLSSCQLTPDLKTADNVKSSSAIEFCQRGQAASTCRRQATEGGGRMLASS